jgi:hypothetical protein
MGMRSTFITQELEVTDTKKLLEAINGLDTDDLVDKDGKVNFENWDDMKIEGYWYGGTMRILHRIAPFVEGYAEFEYEEGYLYRIIFEKGKLLFQRTEHTWLDTSELIGDSYEDEVKTE